MTITYSVNRKDGAVVGYDLKEDGVVFDTAFKNEKRSLRRLDRRILPDDEGAEGALHREPACRRRRTAPRRRASGRASFASATTGAS